MRGGAVAQTETRADRRARMRLRRVAGEWFPTIADDVLDRIVATAWIEGRAENGGRDERTAIAAAAAVRRYGPRALRGEEIALGEAEAATASPAMPVAAAPKILTAFRGFPSSAEEVAAPPVAAAPPTRPARPQAASAPPAVAP